MFSAVYKETRIFFLCLRTTWLQISKRDSLFFPFLCDVSKRTFKLWFGTWDEGTVSFSNSLRGGSTGLTWFCDFWECVLLHPQQRDRQNKKKNSKTLKKCSFSGFRPEVRGVRTRQKTHRGSFFFGFCGFKRHFLKIWKNHFQKPGFFGSFWRQKRTSHGSVRGGQFAPPKIMGHTISSSSCKIETNEYNQ